LIAVTDTAVTKDRTQEYNLVLIKLFKQETKQVEPAYKALDPNFDLGF
jgi:hypothetical protein